MSSRTALRLSAIALAIAGVIDPAVTMLGPAPQPLTIAILGSADDTAYRVAHQLQSELADRYETRVRSQIEATDASPCPAAGACVLVSDGTTPRRITSGGPLGAVRIHSRRPAAAIKHLTTSGTVDPDARGAIDALLDVTDGDKSPAVRVFDGDVLVGESTTSRIEWTPIATGLRDLRVVTSDDQAHIAVDVTSERYEILFFEPRPTWSATFIRRALEADPRFVLRSQAAVAKNITVSTAAATLDVPTLERTDPRVVIVGAVDELTAAEVSALEQFMTRRGGTVIALVEQTPTGPARVLLPFTLTGHREAEPVPIGSLKASEFVTFASQDRVTRAVAVAGGAPVIVSRPAGNGMLVAYGASDAWRFRHERDAFNAFWQSLVADAATAAGEPLTVAVDKRLAKPRERVRIVVEWRPLRGVPSSVEARAAVSCGDGLQPIRLWPEGAAGRFVGEFVASLAGACRVTATLNTISGSTSLLVRDAPTVVNVDDDRLRATIAAYGGTLVNAGDEDVLVTALRRSASPVTVSTPVHPLRSPWWIVPFAACLGGEWWLRRRSGAA